MSERRKTAFPTSRLPSVPGLLRLRHWLVLGIGGVIGISAAALTILGGLLLVLSAERPARTGTLPVPGLIAPVQVTRDADGMPHLSAADMTDAYRALGFAHAQDRLFQMEFMRRMASGRLAELTGALFGNRTIEIDRFYRTLGLAHQAEASVAALEPEVRHALESYAAGVNAWLDGRTVALPVEFHLLAATPEPWRPADSLLILKWMAVQLGGNYRAELRRARLAERLSTAEIEDLIPPFEPHVPTTLSQAGDGSDVPQDVPALIAATLAAHDPTDSNRGASNAWVLAGTRTATGRPLLVNDPHLPLSSPVLWYLARIDTPDLTLAGATLPGLPFHVIARNRCLAWGLTNTHADTQDLFVERLDPTDPGRYLTPDGVAAFAVRTETLKVRGEADRTLTIRSTRHGPVISDLADPAMAAAVPTGHVLALAIAGADRADTSAEGLYHLNRACGRDQVLAALRRHVMPVQNLFYADRDGHIGFVAGGALPVRTAGDDGRLPMPGWTGRHDWLGLVPFEAWPQAFDPPDGRLINANNAVNSPGDRPLLAADWPDAYRARRILELLEAGDRHTVEDAEVMVMDTLSPAARDLEPVLTALPAHDLETAAVLDRLRRWPGLMTRERPEPLIFETWLRTLHRELFAARLGPLYPGAWLLDPRSLQRALKAPERWCPQDPNCHGALQRSLAAALAALRTAYGPDWQKWRWGDAHRAPLAHPLFGMVPLVGGWLSADLETDGSSTTINRGAFGIDEENPTRFPHVHGAGLRAVFDLADLDNSRFMIATGSSGDPLAPNYRNLIERWRDGATLRLAGPGATTGAVLELVPAASAPTPSPP